MERKRKSERMMHAGAFESVSLSLLHKHTQDTDTVSQSVMES